MASWTDSASQPLYKTQRWPAVESKSLLGNSKDPLVSTPKALQLLVTYQRVRENTHSETLSKPLPA